MDPRLVASSSPFLQEQHDFQPSSSTSAAFDISHTETSPYLVDSFAFDQDYAPDGGPFPHTPSYQGSYQNSPYSVLSDLPTFGNEEGPDSLSLFDDNPTGISITEEYDPSEYDHPNSTGLISFDENFMSTMDASNGQVSVSITPPAHDEGSPSPYDHASPASSVGAEDDRRSHGSNASPYMHPNSPPLTDFTQNFESMHFESPSWSTSQLPDRRSPPAPQKTPSPPQLVIPDMASPSNSVHDAPPTINAPEGDGLSNGPQLHIVPATPISGGGAVGQSVQYLQRGKSCSFICLPPHSRLSMAISCASAYLVAGTARLWHLIIGLPSRRRHRRRNASHARLESDAMKVRHSSGRGHYRSIASRPHRTNIKQAMCRIFASLSPTVSPSCTHGKLRLTADLHLCFRELSGAAELGSANASRPADR